jgi:DNA polymerase-1
MRVALVFDAPRTTPVYGGVSGAYLSRVLEACEAAGRAAKGIHAIGPTEQITYREFFAVEDQQSGGKAPPIGEVRKGAQRLGTEIIDWDPHVILTMGTSAMNGVLQGPKALSISKERGRMRYAYDVTPMIPTISPLSVVKSPDLHRDFANDVYKALTQQAPLPAMKIDLLVANTPDELASHLVSLEGASVVGVDVETTGLSPYRDTLLALGIGAVYDSEHGVAVIVPRDLLAHPEVPDILWDAIWRRERRAVGHNFKFDMQFIAPIVGWAPQGASFGDTLLLSHLLDERPNHPNVSRVRGLGLKDAVAVRYDYQYGFDFGNFYETREEERDYDAMHAYLGDDVCYTARYWLDLEEEANVETPRLMECHETLIREASRTIAIAEFNGAPIDREWVQQTISQLGKRIDSETFRLKSEITKLTSRDVDNIMAPKQIADVMYDDWKMTPDIRKHGVVKNNDRSTDKDHITAAIAKYRGTDRDAEATWLEGLQALRHDVRQRTTYQSSLLDKIDDDGRVRANFLLHGTATGRLSSQNPNLQNVPAMDREDSDKELPMRRAFRPIDGWQWVEVDYSQLELRVAAGLSGDEDFIDVFRGGRDIHMEVAVAIFNRPAEEIKKAERFLAKAISFGIIYGRGARALATGAEMRYAERELGMKPWTEEQAAVFIQKFLRSYPTLSGWISALHRDVPVQGYVESYFGRRRRFPLTPRSKGELGSIQRQAVNTPVQSAASDICLTAMGKVERALEETGIPARVLFPVHDSICLEVEAFHVAELEAICRAAMEIDFCGVPLKVDYEYGPSWAEVKGA